METQTNFTEEFQKQRERRNTIDVAIRKSIENTIFCNPRDAELVKSAWPLHSCVEHSLIVPGEVWYNNKDFFIVFKIYERPTVKHGLFYKIKNYVRRIVQFILF